MKKLINCEVFGQRNVCVLNQNKQDVAKYIACICQSNSSPNFMVWKFVGRHSFHIVSGDSPETMRKLCLSTKFPHHEIRLITVFCAVLNNEKSEVINPLNVTSLFLGPLINLRKPEDLWRFQRV